MTSETMRRYRATLTELSQRLGGDLDQISGEALRQNGGEASGGLSDVPLHTADLGTDHAEREVSLLLMENEVHILGQIRAAIDRIDRGTFGRCEDCGRAIPRERLNAVPYASRCRDCADAWQNDTGR